MSYPNTNNFTQSLRAATQTQHKALESLPFNHALLNESLPLSVYLQQLHSYYAVQSHLETGCKKAITQCETLAQVWQHYVQHSTRIQQDLSYFQALDQAQATAPTDTFISTIKHWAAHQPHALIGCLYVFQGSMLGAQVLLPHVQTCFQLSGEQGCYYYAGAKENVQQQWNTFKQSLEQAGQQADAAAEIIHGAQVSFEHIYHILADLLPATQ